MDANTVSGEVVGAAIKVHRALGPGLLESAYRTCMRHELSVRGLEVHEEALLPVRYDGLLIDAGYRIDLLVADIIVVELKTVVRLLPVHQAQLLSYLRLSGRSVGLLINFNVWRLKDGIKRMVV